MKRTLTLLLITVGLALGACSSAPPKAWERGTLASPEMAWDDDAMAAAQGAHTHSSKEQASGGASAGGGGCGCNN